MGRIVVSEFVTLDGVMEDPGGAEAFELGGWAFQFDRGADGDRFKLDELMAAEALLLGRRTYEGFAAAWPGRTDDIGFADRMNGVAKYVVSGTLARADWQNSTVVGADVPAAVARVGAAHAGDVLVAGSAQLVRTLLDHDLVDELRLMVFPVVLGAGKRLFTDGAAPRRFAATSAVTSGQVVMLTLRRPAGAPG